ncbi:Gfo/Idh/MocA family oxidoreductase [Paraburkholderia phenoliruptrix]|uniref:Gfo/Idh/MocA family oxidoreductase n=1 Tax=Paraburkholderia phenoliruptrix TaxID=252970 RepID=A0ABV3WM05_9BURK
MSRAYASADELLADADIDIVLNLTTPQAHGAVTLAALRAGKNVYSEKPLGVSRSTLSTCSAARFDPLLSIVTVSGSPFCAIAFSK